MDIQFVLRSNIKVAGDVELARRELSALLGTPVSTVIPINSKDELLLHATELPLPGLASTPLRHPGPIGFEVRGIEQASFDTLIRRLAFFQAIWAVSDNAMAEACEGIAEKLGRVRSSNTSGNWFYAIPLMAVLEYSGRFVFQAEHITDIEACLSAMLAYLLDGEEPEHYFRPYIKAAIAAAKTSLHLTHELHVYKAKFFPRLVRSLINIYLPEEDLSQKCLLDPFVGSGTALLEASLVGLASVGLDIDPISVLISQNKIEPFVKYADLIKSESQRLQEAFTPAVSGQLPLFRNNSDISLNHWENYKFELPEPINSRLVKLEDGLYDDLVEETSKILCALAQVDPVIQPVFRVVLSHALTKKVRFRFVGIGNGRFTLDIAKKTVLEIFLKKLYHLKGLASVFIWLQDRLELSFAPSSALQANAVELSAVVAPESVDICLTSPPYLPASSGREQYAKARSIPLVALGLWTNQISEIIDARAVGGMENPFQSVPWYPSTMENHNVPWEKLTPYLEQLPSHAKELVKFLYDDRQRAIKAVPTLKYLLDIKSWLQQLHSTLTVGGFLLLVVALEHGFYVHKTREVLFTVHNSVLMAEIAQGAGYKHLETINVELQKSGGLNARPRSTESYSEAVVVLQKI